MTDIIVKRFSQCNKSNGSTYPIFGFAVEDYISKYGIEQKDVDKMYVWGAILEPSDNCDEIFDMFDVLTISDHLALFVFDVNNISNEFVEKIKETFVKYEQFSEIEDCYEYRIVFGRIVP